jgi:hypothetical protein
MLNNAICVKVKFDCIIQLFLFIFISFHLYYVARIGGWSEIWELRLVLIGLGLFPCLVEGFHQRFTFCDKICLIL